jgi:hypothetical protein
MHVVGPITVAVYGHGTELTSWRFTEGKSLSRQFSRGNGLLWGDQVRSSTAPQLANDAGDWGRKKIGGAAADRYSSDWNNARAKRLFKNNFFGLL